MQRTISLSFLAAWACASAQPGATPRELDLAREAIYCAHLGAKVLQLSSSEKSASRQERGLAATRALAIKSMSPEEMEAQFESAKAQVLADFRNKVREDQMLPGVLERFLRERSAACAASRDELKRLQEYRETPK